MPDTLLADSDDMTLAIGHIFSYNICSVHWITRSISQPRSLDRHV